MKKALFYTQILILLGFIASAQPGSLDASFGTAGKVTTDFGGDDHGTGLVIQSDDKLVLAGFSFNGSDYDFALARYNADGSLDNTFGITGKVTTPIGSDDDDATCVTLQNDGK